MAVTLKPGNKAPSFKAPNEKGKLVKLEDYKGKKLILYFYGSDGSPTCTNQACNLRDNYQSFMKKGYSILGVSTDSVKKHANFIKKYKLPFSLLSDPDHQVNELYGVWDHKVMFGREYLGTLRTTFIIDERGKIEKVIEKVESKKHAEQIL